MVQYVGFFGNLGGRRAIEAEVSENTCLESNMCSRGGDCQLADDITVGQRRKAERSERFGLVRVCLAQNEPNSVCTCTPTRTTEHVFLHGYVLKKL